MELSVKILTLMSRFTMSRRRPLQSARSVGSPRLFRASDDPVVTDFYGWGPWVNGGAWIHTDAGKLDLLYRNLHQVRQTIDEAQRGIVHHDYYQQPVYGFYSVIYLAETAACIPLHDPMGRIANLKRKVAKYPSALRQRIVGDSLWMRRIHAEPRP